MTRRRSRESRRDGQGHDATEAFAEIVRKRSKEYQKVQQFYDAQAGLSRRGVVLIVAAIVLTIGLFVAINYKAWSVALSMLGMASSLFTGGYLSFVVGAADGVFAKVQSH